MTPGKASTLLKKEKKDFIREKEKGEEEQKASSFSKEKRGKGRERGARDCLQKIGLLATEKESKANARQ